MKTYLVDFENVKSKGLSGIDRLTDEDHVIIFYSENSDTISFEMHCMVLQAKAEVDYMKVRVGGKNALDFQLSTLLGYLVAKGGNSHIFIISNDKGFDKLHDFWENTFDDSPACKVFRTSNISAAVNYARYNAAPIEEEPEEELPEDIEEVSQFPEFESDPEESGYGEDFKVVEFDLAEEENGTDSGDVEIPPSMVGEIIAGAPKDHSASYTKEQPVVKPISGPSGRNGLPSMPKVIAPGVRHPMLAADEAQAELYEPLFEQFLRTPEGKDKHALLARFMPGADDRAVDLMGRLILRSTSKSELHNLLQQKYDNDTSARHYNMVKRNYYFLKRVLRGDETGESTSQAHETEKPAPLQQPQPKPAQPQPQPKPAAEKPAAPAAEVQPVKVPAEKKAQEAAAPEGTAPRKADAELKKRLHELLDQKADADEFSGVIAVINVSASKQQLYINMMQRFRRGRGRELYNLIKDEYVKFADEEKPEKKPAPAEEKPADAKSEKAPAKEKQSGKSKAVKGGKTAAKQEKAPEAEKPAKTEKPAKSAKSGKSEKPAKAEKAEKSGKAAGEKKAPAANAVKVDISAGNADEKLRELCSDNLVDDLEFVRLRQLVSENESAHKLYLAMIKTFGKKRGSAMYNAVKPLHGEFAAVYGKAAK